jgi:hypothetical protein
MCLKCVISQFSFIKLLSQKLLKTYLQFRYIQGSIWQHVTLSDVKIIICQKIDKAKSQEKKTDL